MFSRTIFRCWPLAILLLLGAQSASADTIVFTFQGNASGSIGNTSFTDSAFTITLTADSNSISNFTVPCAPSPCTIFDVPATTATISADGMSTAITSPIGVFDNQTVAVLGLSRITGSGISGLGMDLMDLSSPIFGTYDLSTPIGTVGPVNLGGMGSEFSCASGCVITAIGDVSMSSASQVTFTDPKSVPEPNSIVLLGTGVLLVAGIRRKARANFRV
jgi:PEP-CTERM motif-containing protein